MSIKPVSIKHPNEFGLFHKRRVCKVTDDLPSVFPINKVVIDVWRVGEKYPSFVIKYIDICCHVAVYNSIIFIGRVKSDVSESGSPNGDTKYANNDVSPYKSETDSVILCSKCNVDVSDKIEPPNHEDAFCACTKGIGCKLNDESSTE